MAPQEEIDEMLKALKDLGPPPLEIDDADDDEEESPAGKAVKSVLEDYELAFKIPLNIGILENGKSKQRQNEKELKRLTKVGGFMENRLIEELFKEEMKMKRRMTAEERQLWVKKRKNERMKEFSEIHRNKREAEFQKKIKEWKEKNLLREMKISAEERSLGFTEEEIRKRKEIRSAVRREKMENFEQMFSSIERSLERRFEEGLAAADFFHQKGKEGRERRKTERKRLRELHEQQAREENSGGGGKSFKDLNERKLQRKREAAEMNARHEAERKSEVAQWRVAMTNIRDLLEEQVASEVRKMKKRELESEAVRKKELEEAMKMKEERDKQLQEEEKEKQAKLKQSSSSSSSSPFTPSTSAPSHDSVPLSPPPALTPLPPPDSSVALVSNSASPSALQSADSSTTPVSSPPSSEDERNRVLQPSLPNPVGNVQLPPPQKTSIVPPAEEAAISEDGANSRAKEKVAEKGEIVAKEEPKPFSNRERKDAKEEQARQIKVDRMQEAKEKKKVEKKETSQLEKEREEEERLKMEEKLELKRKIKEEKKRKAKEKKAKMKEEKKQKMEEERKKREQEVLERRETQEAIAEESRVLRDLERWDQLNTEGKQDAKTIRENLKKAEKMEEEKRKREDEENKKMSSQKRKESRQGTSLFDLFKFNQIPPQLRHFPSVHHSSFIQKNQNEEQDRSQTEKSAPSTSLTRTLNRNGRLRRGLVASPIEADFAPGDYGHSRLIEAPG
eukprot:GDKK01002852.1.p1 GENE.GDKK01002852.1~~GDKK01002852.1.p1  ORF type:complete len:734 (-),score=275.73 GDKK01002852.1:141-2342(-)